MELNFKQMGHQGEPLLILHGLFGTLDNWQTLGRQYSETHQVYLIDLRNHGRSPHADTMSFAEMAADLLEFLDQESLQAPALFGHSLGGKVAMQMACQHPERLSRLVVADIAPVSYPPGHNAILEGLAAIEPQSLTSRRDADEQLARYVDELSVRQFILKSLERDSEGGFRWRMNVPAIIDNYDDMRLSVCDDGVYSGPTLFLRGENSGYIAERNHEEIARKFPQSSIVTVPGTSHWLHAEQPETVANHIINFLQADR